MLNTFSENSLRVLEKSLEEYKEKYIDNLSIFKKDDRAILGQKFHSLICQYIKGFDVSKIIMELNEAEIKIWQKLEEKLKEKKNNFIETEYPFLIKESLNLSGQVYFLTGRFDAVYKENDNYIIYDWKTLNLPKNPKTDLQSVVYLFCASKIYSPKVKIRYLSIEKLDFIDVEFENEKVYKDRIEKIILKLFNNQIN